MEGLCEHFRKQFAEERKERNRGVERYWKLKSVQRLDYLKHKERLEEEYKYYGLHTTISISKIFFGVFIFIFILGYLGEISIRILGLKILLIYLKIMCLAIIVDVLMIFFCSHYKIKKTKELNKRFKLVNDKRNI